MSNAMGQRVNVFDLVSVRNYHSQLIKTWLHLSKDGIVSRDDEQAFTDIGSKCITHIVKTKQFPEYPTVVGWIPDIMENRSY